MTSGTPADGDLARVEQELVRDQAAVAGALDRWRQSSDRQRRRWIVRLARSERRRAEFEAQFADDPVAVVRWRSFPVTEQREILSTIDYLRLGPRSRALRRAVEGVRRGSDYRRSEGTAD